MIDAALRYTRTAIALHWTAALLIICGFTLGLWMTELEMSPLELVLVGTVMELSIFVFEVPTGIVADTTSRRLSIVIGNVVMGIGFIVLGVWLVARFP